MKTKSTSFSKRTMEVILIVSIAITSFSYAQTTVNSLQALKPYLDDNNVNVKLAPGTYTIDADDISSGNWGYTPHNSIDYAKSVMLFSGNNSTFDFTGVTIEFNSDLFTTFGNVDVWELHVIGNNNTLKNLNMLDDASVNDAPRRGVTNVVIDGKQNVLEGFYVTTKGSFPYAYGDSFGKGSGASISHKKHSGILIRGDYNTLKNTTLIQRAFGHCLFMQAANHPTIEGCYVEGEMRSTDDMLAEAGTGSPADEIDFMTDWGYKLPSGYMKALCEEGIRSYNAGETILDGVYIDSRGTNDITLKNNIVKNARGGCSIVLSSGDNHVENISLIGCEFGFSVGSTTLIDCEADCVYGAAYMNAYDDKRNTIKGDLTILPPSDAYYNGGGVAAFFGGSNSNINLHSGGGTLGKDLVIRIGGNTGNVAHNESANHTATGNTINNYTGYPIVINSGSSNNVITTCGDVTNNGANNTIKNSDDCEVTSVCGGFDAFSSIQGEDFCDTKGGKGAGESSIGSLFDGDWAVYNDVEFGNNTAGSIEIVLAKAHTGATTIDVYIDSLGGNSIGTISVPYTGGWYTWETISQSISNITGTHDVYLSFSNSDPSTGVVNVESFKFIKGTTATPITQSFTPDPNKTYYIDALYHNLRLAANGVSEDTYTTSTNTTGVDVEWRFIQNANGYWHIQRAAGGTVPRLRTDNTEFADMQGTAWNGIYTYYSITTGYMDNTYFLTLPDAPEDHQRLQINSEGNARFVPTSHALTWESFEITEVPNSSSPGNLAINGTATQSTTDYGGAASRAIDGNTSGTYSNESVTHTEVNDNNAWWQVDLGSNQSISSVAVWNRTDSCCSSRLSNFKIVVLNSNGQVTYERILNNFTPNPSYTTISSGTVGRYVRIELIGAGTLSLAEVEVFGNGSGAKNVFEEIVTENVILYPNPIEAITTIKGAKDATLEIYDMKGSLLFTKNISLEIEEVNLSDLSSGIYYAKISSIQAVDVIKIVKE